MANNLVFVAVVVSAVILIVACVICVIIGILNIADNNKPDSAPWFIVGSVLGIVAVVVIGVYLFFTKK
jgi:CDP-diglyceride synthetase